MMKRFYGDVWDQHEACLLTIECAHVVKLDSKHHHLPPITGIQSNGAMETRGLRISDLSSLHQ